MRNLFDGWHIVVLAVVILLLFGWKKMPDMARSFGRSARILRSEMDEMKNDKKSEAAGQTVKGQATTPPATPAAAPPPAPAATPQAPAAGTTPTVPETPAQHPADHNTTA
ncbi:Sec-independent protein translocase subunit TatA [Allobranchiibius sp. GilTou38]|uniref:Sec-independent protein translocase subunit TatA n=1 Tax=Allobranchiibius sp. GilTou38 TaxID=2815210 RepID=UPI001AA15ABF|nr:Sec-independent protein translocase subunit TatA [Allobranchiibius sp. GilTou38]MBO1766424.1 Sec-independent protein translocase subunit TatA [Allobranchiibius sp. GilTou38]